MSLYSDLNEVLTPYAQRIKGLARADTELRADLADVDNHTVKSAEQLISDKRTVDKVPYKYRASQSGKSDRAYDCIVGGTVCFNQITKNMRGNSTEKGLTFVNNNNTITISGTVTEAFDYNTVMLTNNTVNFKRDGSKYLLMLNKGIPFAWGVNGYGNVIPAGNKAGIWTNNSGGVWKNGLAFRVGVGQTVDIHELKASVFDLTAMFGTAIADHIYALEQVTAGDGVALFRQMFPNDYYPYNAGSLISVDELSVHVMRDADDNIIGSYPLDSSLTLRGVPVLKDGKIEFDGDTYEADGTVTRRYAERAYQSGDESLANAITDGTKTVYKLSAATTETATPYTNPQVVSPYGTEEYISESVCPVGHVTEYPDNLRAKIDGLPWDLSMVAPVEVTYTATRNYTVNQLLIVDNTLYKVTTNIANGGTITPNSNVTATTLSEVIASLS